MISLTRCQRSRLASDIARQLTVEPRAGQRPVAFHGSGRRPRRLSGFLDAQAAEKAQLDDLALSFVLRRERPERFVDRDDVFRSLARRCQVLIEGDPMKRAAALLSDYARSNDPFKSIGERSISAIDYPDQRLSAYTRLDARVTYSAGEHWKLAAFANNFTDEKVQTARVDFTTIVGAAVDTYDRPRWFGISVQISDFSPRSFH